MFLIKQSSLDIKTERDIQKNLHQISERKTTLIIAHRLSTIIHTDEIIYMLISGKNKLQIKLKLEELDFPTESKILENC